MSEFLKNVKFSFISKPKFKAKSLYRSHTGSHFYGTEYEIWADLGRSAIQSKKIWADYEQLLRVFFSSFHGQKMKYIYFLKYCSIVLALKSYILKEKVEKNM